MFLLRLRSSINRFDAYPIIVLKTVLRLITRQRRFYAITFEIILIVKEMNNLNGEINSGRSIKSRKLICSRDRRVKTAFSHSTLAYRKNRENRVFFKALAENTSYC